MAIAHVVFKSSSTAPPAALHAEYILRAGQYKGRGPAAWVESGNMPEFAQADERAFWVAADTHERVNGRAYTEIQLALPRELDKDRRLELAREAAREFMGDRFAYTLAVHVPVARDKVEQPHLHLMFSERAVDETTRTLPKEHFFRRNGAKKDPAWNARTKPEEIRQRWCEMMNRAMEEAGVEDRVDPRSYKDRGRGDLAELREPKLLAGSEEDAQQLRAHVDDLREQRAELPPAHLDREEAAAWIDRETEAQIAEVERRHDEEMSLLDRAIAELKRLAAKVFGQKPQQALPDHIRKLAQSQTAAAYLRPYTPKPVPDVDDYWGNPAQVRVNPGAAWLVKQHLSLLERNDAVATAAIEAGKERDSYAAMHPREAGIGLFAKQSPAYKELVKVAADANAAYEKQRPAFEASLEKVVPLWDQYNAAMEEEARKEKQFQADQIEVGKHRSAFEQEMQRAEKVRKEKAAEIVAVRLNQEQVRMLIVAENPGNKRDQDDRMMEGIHAGRLPRVMEGRAELDYSPAQQLYFAALQQGHKEAFDHWLTKLTNEKQERKRQQRERSRGKERDFGYGDD